MCFLCSGILCCSSRSVSHTKINNSETVSLDEACATWYRKSEALVIRPAGSPQKVKHLSLQTCGRMDPGLKDPGRRSRPTSRRILQDADRRNGNLPQDPDYDSVQGSEDEEDIYAEIPECLTELDSTTSYSDMSTQTEWANGWEDMPAQSYPTDYEKCEDGSADKDHNDSVQLTEEEMKLLESRLNWLNRDSLKRRDRDQQQRYSVNIAAQRKHHHRHRKSLGEGEKTDRGGIRSVVLRPEDEHQVAQLRKELAKISLNCQHHMRKIIYENDTRRSSDVPKIQNDNRWSSKEASGNCTPGRGTTRAAPLRPQRSSDTTSDNVSSPPEEGRHHESSPSSSSAVYSCSCTSCSCSESCWAHEPDCFRVAQAASESTPAPMQTSSSPTSGNTDDWVTTSRGVQLGEIDDCKMTSSSSSSFLVGSSFKADSEEWVFVVSSSLSPDQELWFAQKADFEDTGNGPYPPRRGQIMLTPQQLLDKGRPTCGTIQETETTTTSSSQEVTPKRAARKQALKERALQIEEERSEATTDEEEGLDNAGQRARQRRTRRRRNPQDKQLQQTAGLGRILMVQAEYGQRSKVLGRDALHITAV